MTGSIVLNGTKKILYPGENDLGQGIKAVLEYKKVTDSSKCKSVGWLWPTCQGDSRS